MVRFLASLIAGYFIFVNFCYVLYSLFFILHLYERETNKRELCTRPEQAKGRPHQHVYVGVCTEGVNAIGMTLRGVLVSIHGCLIMRTQGCVISCHTNVVRNYYCE